MDIYHCTSGRWRLVSTLPLGFWHKIEASPDNPDVWTVRGVVEGRDVVYRSNDAGQTWEWVA